MVRANFQAAESRAESRNGRVLVHGRALYKEVSTQSLQTLARFTDHEQFPWSELKYTRLKKGKRKFKS